MVSMPSKAITYGSFVLAVTSCALLLTGCTSDAYKRTCVWHSDLNIKGCGYYDFKSCIHHCTYCVRDHGPDECDQLKCAAYCAKRDGDDDCRHNYKKLCDIAVMEQTNLESCNVDCSAARRGSPRSGGLLLLLSLSHAAFSYGAPRSAGRAQRFILLCILAAMGVVMHGCCKHPKHQLNWDPDFEDLKKKVDWYDENGLWRGNPTWQFTPEHEAERWVCKTMHESRPICVVWSSEEWNCREHDFGVCKCHTLATDGEYCQAWGCHSLEADQELCERRRKSKNNEVRTQCSYSRFHMDETRYHDMVAKQERGDLLTGESVWWTWNWGKRTGNNRLLSEYNNTSDSTFTIDAGPSLVNPANSTSLLGAAATDTMTHAPTRMLQAQSWPPAAAYAPATRWRYFHWDDVCIANGDNVAIVSVKCPRWREVETEISQCACKKGSAYACLEWSCEEKDVGLFSVLFRTAQPIDAYTVGTEKEEFKCKTTAGSPERCVAWEGEISSAEEAEWVRCECQDSRNCHGVGAVWKCDEYELPKNRGIFFPEYAGRFVAFALIEFFLLVLLLGAFCKGGESTGVIIVVGITTFISLCLVFPFLMVTFGCPGFLIITLPPCVLRCGCCACSLCRSEGDEPFTAKEDSSVIGASVIETE